MSSNSKAYKLITFLESQPLSLQELEAILNIKNYNKILTILCSSMKLYIGELQKIGQLENNDFLSNFFTTMRTVIENCDRANLRETLKSVQEMNRRILKLEPSIQENDLTFYLEQLEVLLMDKLDTQYQDNYYEFISYLVYDIRSLVYIRQTLASKPHYVNAKNKEGKHIVLELIDKYCIESRMKGNSKLLSYYGNAIMTFMNAPRFHLSIQEIEKYTQLLEEEITKVSKDNISVISFYKELLSLFNQKHDDQEIITSVNNEFGIRMDFSLEVQQEIETLREQPYIITIDSQKTLDMDDALSITKQGDCYHLHVYISDVASLVPEGSLVDREAYKRTETLYFADPLIPMLPPILSESLLSLNTQGYKSVIEGVIDIYENGDIAPIRIRQNHIMVDKKCNYDQINGILNGDEASPILKKTVSLLAEVAGILKKQSSNRLLYREIKDMRSSSQGIERHKVDYRFRTQAEVIIEEIMVLWNSQVAQFFSEKGYPCIYRVHPGPTTTQAYNSLLQLKEYIMGNYPNPTEYTKMANSLLSMYPQAYYSTRNIGHYGLYKDYYCHASSPIRRYPDIIVQRLIYDYIFSEPSRQKDQVWIPKLEEMSQYCNERMEENIQYQIRMQHIRSLK